MALPLLLTPRDFGSGKEEDVNMRNAVWVMIFSAAGAAGVRADDEPLTLGSELSLDLPADDDKDSRPQFTFGPMGGYLKAREADKGTWFGGVQARVRFLRVLAVEASISFHQNRYADGDVVVTQYPVQLSALLLPITSGPLDPYVLAGGGWYYSRIDYDDSIGGGDDTDRSFAVHVGAGTNVRLSPQVSLFADFRWVFLDEPGVDNSNIEDEEFDYRQITFGLSFGF